MKKITFNAPLNHKAYSYEPMQIEVEKIIPLYPQPDHCCSADYQFKEADTACSYKGGWYRSADR